MAKFEYERHLAGRLKEAPQMSRTTTTISDTRLRVMQEGIGEAIRMLPGHYNHIGQNLQAAWVGIDDLLRSRAERKPEWQDPLPL